MPALNLIHKGNRVLYVALLFLLLPVLLLGYHLLQKTGGSFSLPGDEAFFQLSTAKALAFKQVWGIEKYKFAAASPSLAYPLLLAVVFFIFGAHLIITPVVNTAIAVILLISVQRWLTARAVGQMTQLVTLLAIILLTPLPVMIIYGMEHSLLLLFAFLFVRGLSNEWAGAEFSRRTLIYGALMVATSYNGAVLVAGVFLLLLWRRKWLVAFEVTLWSLMPVLAFGVITLWKGSFFLPNIFMVTSAESQFSYDWLIGCGIALLPVVPSWLLGGPGYTVRWVGVIAIVALSLLLMTRNVYALREADRRSLQVYHQEFPAGQFLRLSYRRYCMVSDHMGVVSYLADGRYIDLSGIANNKIVRGRVDHYPVTGLIKQLGDEDNAQVAAISDQYTQTLPETWIRTASWKIPGSDLYPSKTLVFYAMDSLGAVNLKDKLTAYSPFLPKDIQQFFFFAPPK